MFSYVSPEERVPRLHPLRPIPKRTDRALQEILPRFAQLYAKNGRPFDPTREGAPRAPASDALLHSQQTHADGTTGLQPTVSLVRRAEHGRTRSGFRPYSAKIATGCWKATWPRSSSPRCWPKPGRTTCSVMSISAWMERWWKPGPGRRAVARATMRGGQERRT
jgi:hypothetical protein